MCFRYDWDRVARVPRVPGRTARRDIQYQKSTNAKYHYSLDKPFRIIKIIHILVSLFMQSLCDHKRTQVIARRDGVDYVECLDCRQIFEAEDLEPVTVEEEEE